MDLDYPRVLYLAFSYSHFRDILYCDNIKSLSTAVTVIYDGSFCPLDGRLLSLVMNDSCQ